jgi:hypothetical protein
LNIPPGMPTKMRATLMHCVLVLSILYHSNGEQSPDNGNLQLRGENGHTNITDIHEEQSSLGAIENNETYSSHQALPLRPDDYDANVGGAGRDNTCTIPSGSDKVDDATPSDAQTLDQCTLAADPQLSLRGGDGKGADEVTASSGQDSHATEINTGEEAGLRDIATMSTREIRTELKSLHVNTAGCVEKADFVAKLREARAAAKTKPADAPTPAPTAQTQTPPLRGGGGGEDEQPAAAARPQAARKAGGGKKPADAPVPTPPLPPIELWDPEAWEAGDGQLAIRTDLTELAVNASQGDACSQFWLAQLYEAGAVDADGNVTVPVDVYQVSGGDGGGGVAAAEQQ